MSKITRVAEYFVNKYNESVQDTDDIFSIINHYLDTRRYVDHPKGEGRLDVNHLGEHSSIDFINPKLRNVKYLNINRIVEIRDYLLQEYDIKYTFSGKRFNIEKRSWKKRLSFRNIDVDDIYVFTDLSNTKKNYFRDTLGYKNKDFVRKERNIKLGARYKLYSGTGYDNYVKLLELHKYPKSEWRERIKECQYVISLLVSRFIDADKIEVPQEWIESKKKVRVQNMVVNGTNVRKKKLIGEVVGKVAEPLERYVSGKNCKFVSETIQMKEAHRCKKLTIYGGQDKESLIQKLFSVFSKRTVRFVIFSDRELKNLKDLNLHNWMEIDKFMEGKHIVFKRAVTAYVINKLYEKNEQVFRRLNILEGISTVLCGKMEKLRDYKEQYYLHGDEELMNAAVKLAEEFRLFDTKIYDVYKEVKFILERLKFINPVFGAITSYNNKDEGLISAVRDLFKYYKQRIDWQYYNLPVNEEMKEDEARELLELSEEELTN